MVFVESFMKRSHWKEDKQKRKQRLHQPEKNKNQSTRPETKQGMTVGQKDGEGHYMLKPQGNVVWCQRNRTRLPRDYFVNNFGKNL